MAAQGCRSGSKTRRPSGSGERQLRLVLAEGETRDVVLDASVLVPARIELRVLVDGEPLVDGVVRVARSEGQTTRNDGGGRTDARGTWSTLVRPGLAIAVEVHGDDGLPLASTGVLTASPGEVRRFDFTTRTGEVVIEFPESFVLPDSGSVQADVFDSSGPGFAGTAPRWDRIPSTDGTLSRAWTGRRIVLGRCAAGDWKLSVDVFERVPRGEHSWRHELLLPKVERPITVRPGETTVVVIR